ncbi:MAG: winged helix-turn-helix domain-containing protein, partial [Bryobacterales bacterium]|nr:winged helix-turn-helix domain-containing protein [Bryobacterales bacterium]
RTPSITDRFVLRKHDVRIKLQRQPFKLLLLLIRHKGTVVTRDIMIQELWGDGTQVDFDRSLNFCISQIRSALCDDSASPEYIETVHREGYRFLGEVQQVEAGAPLQPPESPRRLPWYRQTVVISLLSSVPPDSPASQAQACCSTAPGRNHLPLHSPFR